MHTFFNRLRYFAILAVIQTLIFDQIHLFGYATVYIYLLFILKIPRFVSRNELMIWSFTLGLFIDIFGNTPGVNAAAATAMAFMRNKILSWFIPNGINEDFIPGIKFLHWGAYISYATMNIIIFCTVLFMLELFTLRTPLYLAASVASSTLLTLLFIITAEFFDTKKK